MINRYIIFVIIALGGLFVPKGHLSAELTESERRRGLRVMKNIDAIIKSYSDEITAIKNVAGGIEQKKELAKIKDEIKRLKDSAGITKLKEQLENEFQPQIDKIAAEIYVSAIDPKTKQDLFKNLNQLLLDIKNDAIINEKVQKIIQLRQEISDRVQSKIGPIQKLGKNIDEVTKDLQLQLNKIKNDMLAVQQAVKTIQFSKDYVEKLAPLRRKQVELQQAIANQLARLPGQQRNKIQSLENAINRFKLIQEYLRNPDIIQLTTEEEILGLKLGI